MRNFIPLSIPNFEGNEKKYVDEAIEQGWVSTGGAFITRLEQDTAKFLEVQNVAACQSGTAALHLALVDAGVEVNDVVLVPTLTFIAAVNPVMYQKAKPVFIDCDDSLCMDPIKLREFCEQECQIKDGKLFFKDARVKALIVVHVFGNMADMEAIMDIANLYNIKVIEDATEALGTKYTIGRYKGKYAGTIGDYGAYSFNGNKIITTGGGGAITAKKNENVEHIRYLSTQAKDDSHFYIHNEIGYNYRMTNLQAAVGVAQLEKLPEYIKRKQKNYLCYLEYFKDFKGGKLLGFREGVESNMWFYSVLLDEKTLGKSVAELVACLEEKQIQTRTIWGLIHEQQPYQNEVAYRIEKAKWYSERIINLPCSTNLKEEDIEYVSATIKELFQ